MRIASDKYYTPVEVANRCVDKCVDFIGFDNITEALEPSVGNGSFLHNKRLRITTAYDIEPQVPDDCDIPIIKADFLSAPITYKSGRLVIGNPPYGRCMSLAQKFYRKSIEISDYVAFILPISQLNNTQSMYQFDLVYSFDLGKQVLEHAVLYLDNTKNTVGFAFSVFSSASARYVITSSSAIQEETIDAFISSIVDGELS